MPNTRSSSKGSTSKPQEEHLKRPANAKKLYCDEKKPAIKEQNKDKKTKEINEILNNMWNELSEDAKKPYEEKAAELKKKYDEEKKKRDSTKGDNDEEEEDDAEEGGSKKRKRAKKTKDPNAPKKPLSAYMLWLKDNRENIKKEHPEAKTTDIAKHAGEKWKQLSEDDKKPFVAKAAELKEEYQKQKAAYEGSEGAAASTPKKKKPAAKKAKSEEDDEEENDEDEE